MMPDVGGTERRIDKMISICDCLPVVSLSFRCLSFAVPPSPKGLRWAGRRPTLALRSARAEEGPISLLGFVQILLDIAGEILCQVIEGHGERQFQARDELHSDASLAGTAFKHMPAAG